MQESYAAEQARIMEVGMGFWPAKILMTAVKLELFTHLGSAGLPASTIRERLGLHGRGLEDFLDSLVSLGFLEKLQSAGKSLYRNTPATAVYLNRNSDAYLGVLLEMAYDRLYSIWGSLEQALKTGAPQSEVAGQNGNLFDYLYRNPVKTAQFVAAMSAFQRENFRVLAESFPFGEVEVLCDVGGADATLSVEVATRHRHLRCISIDLPEVEELARHNVQSRNLADRILIRSANILEEELPRADVITMGNVLHAFDLDTRKRLISKAYEALPRGGSLVVIENIIDENRCKESLALMMSVNMLLETNGGSNFTFTEFKQWAEDCGFLHCYQIPLTSNAAVIAVK